MKKQAKSTICVCRATTEDLEIFGLPKGQVFEVRPLRRSLPSGSLVMADIGGNTHIGQYFIEEGFEMIETSFSNEYIFEIIGQIKKVDGPQAKGRSHV